MYALKLPIRQVMSNTNCFCLVQWNNRAVDWLLEHRPELFKKVLQHIISPSAILMKRSVKRSRD